MDFEIGTVGCEQIRPKSDRNPQIRPKSDQYQCWKWVETNESVIIIAKFSTEFIAKATDYSESDRQTDLFGRT